jgi:lipopolysaccharide transport system permease protein
MTLSPDPSGGAVEAPTAAPVVVLDPSARSSLRASLAELWRYRDLLLILTRRDIGVRYKQAVFGIAWAIVQPLALTAMFAFFLHRSGVASSSGVAYPVYALSGLVAWTFCSNGVMTGSDSLVLASNLVSKVYFPRLALPMASVFSWVPDLGLSLTLLGLLMAGYGVAPGVSLLALPLALSLAALCTLSITIWTSALNVAYRDVKNAVPFVVQFWLFATPGIYTSHHFTGPLQLLVSLNPATATVALMRWALIGTSPASWASVGTSVLASLLLLVTGLRYFRRTERYFADVI